MRVLLKEWMVLRLISNVNTSNESVSKGKMFSELVKMNMYPYHLSLENIW